MIDFLTSLDRSVFVFVNIHHSSFFDFFFHAVSQLGNGWIAVPLAAAVIVAVTPRTFLAKALLCAAIAGITAGIVNTQLKRAVHRQRPAVCFAERQSSVMPWVKGSTGIHIVGDTLRHNSFPSGHASTAFAAATILAALYGGYFFIAYVPALLVAYSRIYMGDHFPLDTVAGALVGIVTSAVVCALFRRRGFLPQPIPMRRRHDKR